MTNIITEKYCKFCGCLNTTEVAIIGDKESFYFTCECCRKINNSTKSDDKISK